MGLIRPTSARRRSKPTVVFQRDVEPRQLEEDEVEELREAFAVFDKDGDGPCQWMLLYPQVVIAHSDFAHNGVKFFSWQSTAGRPMPCSSVSSLIR